MAFYIHGQLTNDPRGNFHFVVLKVGQHGVIKEKKNYIYIYIYIYIYAQNTADLVSPFSLYI